MRSRSLAHRVRSALARAGARLHERAGRIQAIRRAGIVRTAVAGIDNGKRFSTTAAPLSENDPLGCGTCDLRRPPLGMHDQMVAVTAQACPLGDEAVVERQDRGNGSPRRTCEAVYRT